MHWICRVTHILACYLTFMPQIHVDTICRFCDALFGIITWSVSKGKVSELRYGAWQLIWIWQSVHLWSRILSGIVCAVCARLFGAWSGIYLLQVQVRDPFSIFWENVSDARFPVQGVSVHPLAFYLTFGIVGICSSTWVRHPIVCEIMTRKLLVSW